MNILLIEDDPDKKDAIVSFVESIGLNVISRSSTTTGLKELIFNDELNFVILDMSMPVFDMTHDDPTGGGHQSFAGKDILEQMDLRGIDLPVVVVSQFGSFGKGANSVTLSTLDETLRNRYPNIYKTAIFYSSSKDDWKQKLKDELSAEGK